MDWSSRIKSFVSAIVLVMTAAFCCYGQKSDFMKEALYLKSYSGKEFKRSLFFYGSALDKNGNMLFATSSGLFVMSGEKKVKYNTEHVSGITRVTVDRKNNIFVCGDNDFGYFEPQEDGQLRYVSLADNPAVSGMIIDDAALVGEEVWFLGRKGVFCYDYQNITQVSDTGAIKNVNSFSLPFYVDVYGNLFYLSHGKKYFKISLKNLSMNFSRTELSLAGKNADLFITDGRGFFRIENKKANNPSPLNDSDLIPVTFSHTFNSNVRSVAVAYDSLSRRTAVAVNYEIAVFDENLEEIITVDSTNSLPKNDILYLNFDQKHNLWASSLYCVTKIELNTPLLYYNLRHGISGAGLGTVKIGDTLYCYGFDGLKTAKVDDHLKFEAVRFQGVLNRGLICWDVKKIDGSVLAFTSQGIFEVFGGSAERILDYNSIYQGTLSEKFPGKLFIAAYDGLLVADYKKDKTFKISNLHSVNGINFPLWKIASDKNGMLWFSTIFEGVYYVVPKDGDLTRYSIVPVCNCYDGFKSFRQMCFSVDENISIYDYNFYQAKLPQKTDFLSNELHFGVNTLNVNANNIDDNIQCIHIDNSDSVLFRDFDRYVVAKKTADGLRLDTLAIKLDTYTVFSAQKYDSLIFISSEAGLLVYNTNAHEGVPEKEPFEVMINTVTVNGKNVFSGYKYFDGGAERVYSPGKKYVDFGDDIRSLEVSFSASCFESPEKTSYSYFLEGHSTSWSPFKAEDKVNFGQLKPGDYVFKVKAKNYTGLESGTAVYKFSIRQPWFRRWWAYFIYLFLLLCLVGVWVKCKTVDLKQQNLELEQQNQKISSEYYAQNHRLKIMSLVALKSANSVVILDADGEFVYVNHSFKSIYGYTLEDFKNKYSENYFKAVVIEGSENAENIIRAKELCRSQSFEYYHINPEGEKIYSQMAIDPVFDDKNDLCNWIIVETDITQLKKSSEETLEQTKALTTAYMELSTQKAEIEHQKQQLISANDQLETGYEQIARQNITITESMRYAQSIQNSILPSDGDIGEFLDFFTIYLPKDIVSGDFYMYEKLPCGGFITVVADCTGHGVPGAFMSLIGYDILEQIIKISGITSPVEILELLSEKFSKTLKQDSEHNTDGIDLSICKFEPGEGYYDVTFSGTRSSVYVFSEKENKISKIRGSQRQIGYGFEATDKSYSFEPHYFKFMPKDFIVMLSDGLIDQCDKNRRRFGSQRFSEFLVLNADLPMRKLGTLLGNELQDFMGSAGQRDDITVLGFRMKD